MINKKRLVMMAVAASMVLPTNLTYLSMANSISVLATEVTGTNSGKITGDTIPNGFAWRSQTVGSETREVILLDGEISLSSNITITKGTGKNDGPIVIEAGKTATLKLNNYTLTSDAAGVFKVYGGGILNIEGPGTIVCNSTAKNGAAVIWTLGDNPQVTLKNGVNLKVDEKSTLKNNIHGIAANDNVSNGTITVQSSSINIKDGAGVYTNGMIFEDGPIINLNSSTITASIEDGGLGIYQAGDSTINVSGGSITGSCGIETRGGRLNVSDNAEIIGGTTGETMSKKSGFPTNGSTSRNAAIAIAQHVWASTPVSYPAITATIDNAILTGKTALAIVDPEGNQDKTNVTLGEISVTATNSTFNGNVAYTTDKIPFTLTNPTFEGDAKIQKFNHDLSSGTLTPTDSDLESIPYTVINTVGEGEDAGIPAKSITDALPEDATDAPIFFGKGTEEDSPLSLNLSVDALKSLTTVNNKTLGEAFTQSANQEVDVTNEEGDSVTAAPKYLYSVEGLEKATVNEAGITLEGELAASIQLQGESVIKFVLPEEESETQFIEKMETTETEGDSTPAYYVSAKDLGSGNTSGTLEQADINKYFKDKDLVLAADEADISLSYAPEGGDKIALLGENKVVTLDQNNFIEVHLENAPIADLEAPEYTISPDSVQITVSTDGLSKDDIDLDSLGLKLTTENGDPITISTPDYKITALTDGEGNVLDTLTSTSAGKMTITAKDGTSYEVAFTTKPQSSGTTNSGGHKKPTKPAEDPIEPVVGTPTTMYRLYNRLTGEHLYTIDKNERDSLLTSDTWKDEGEGWIAPSVSDYPVYRLLNPNNGDHHYTTDKNEFDTLPSLGWVAEGVAFFSADKDNPENVLLHRLYNPNAKGAGSHHYTADTNERDTLVAQGWTYEGLAWAGLPATK